MIAANQRLHGLRLLNGMGQAEFAAILGVGQSQLSQIERGTRTLTYQHQLAARMYFKLPADYFEKEPVKYSPAQLNFRRKKLSAKAADMAAQTFGLIEENFKDQENKTTTLELKNTPTQRSLAEIEVIAAETRSLIGIKPDTAVRNVTRCMNHIGIVVTELANPLLPAGKIDGISSPISTQSAFVTTLSRDVPGDRYRFSAAHELGHIILHTNDTTKSTEIKEKEADDFASAFLLPKRALLDELSPTLTLNGYGRLKANWAVSMQSIIRRALDLGVINEDRYRSLYIQLSSRGWRKKEPVEVPLENLITPPPYLGISTARMSNPDSITGPNEIAGVTQLFP